MAFLEKYEYRPSYWVYDTPSPCRCCPPVDAMNNEYWDCWTTYKKWKILDEEPDFSQPHDQDICMGNCMIHSLITPNILPLAHPELYQTTWGDYSSDFEEVLRSLETPSQKEERLRREVEEIEKKRIESETQLRFIYSREMHDKSLRGVRKNESPKKYDRPCKWMVGKDKEDSIARGDIPCCWAWEFTNPKTGKIERPRSCMYQHPTESGWREEWDTNPECIHQEQKEQKEQNNRFANLVVRKRK